MKHTIKNDEIKEAMTLITDELDRLEAKINDMVKYILPLNERTKLYDMLLQHLESCIRASQRLSGSKGILATRYLTYALDLKDPNIDFSFPSLLENDEKSKSK